MTSAITKNWRKSAKGLTESSIAANIFQQGNMSRWRNSVLATRKKESRQQGTKTAQKVILNEISSVREISLLKELKHPNIVDLITILVEKEKIYLVFEFMPMDLKQYLDSLKSKILWNSQLLQSYQGSGKFMREKLVRSYMFQLICVSHVISLVIQTI